MPTRLKQERGEQRRPGPAKQLSNQQCVLVAATPLVPVLATVSTGLSRDDVYYSLVKLRPFTCSQAITFQLPFSHLQANSGEATAGPSYFRLSDVWEGYNECSAFGLEVPLTLRVDDCWQEVRIRWVPAV
jgi:hypothetical protein